MFSWASTTRRLLFLLGQLFRGADDLVDKSGQIHRLGIEFELAGFHLGEGGEVCRSDLRKYMPQPLMPFRASS